MRARFQHDGVTSNTAKETILVLLAAFPNRMIDKFEDIALPTYSPDLTPLDISFDGTWKKEFIAQTQPLE